MERGSQLEPPRTLKVASLRDLARFAASLASMGSSVYVIHFAHGGKHIYGFLTVYRDYYKYYGVPIFYYFESDEELQGSYILVKLNERERVEIGDSARPGWIHIPIVTLGEKPDFIEIP